MKSLGINKTGNDNNASEHARTYEVRPTQVKKKSKNKKQKQKSVSIQTICFICASVNNVGA